MENRAHALAAGLFVIFLSTSIAMIAIWFNGDTITRNHYQVVSRTSVTGLNPQAAVYYNGVNIGKVEAIHFDPENMNQILIDISIDQNVTLTQRTYAQLGYQGITGLAYIQLHDHNKQDGPLEEDMQISMLPSLLDEVTVSGQELLSNTNQLAKQAQLLLNDQNQAKISQILLNVERASNHFDRVIDQLQLGIESFTGFTAETRTILTHLDQLSQEVYSIMARINQPGGIIDNLSESSEVLADTLPKIETMSNSITRSAHSADRVLSQLEHHPQSLLFGKPPPQPGPGEEGFVSPLENTQ